MCCRLRERGCLKHSRPDLGRRRCAHLAEDCRACPGSYERACHRGTAQPFGFARTETSSIGSRHRQRQLFSDTGRAEATTPIVGLGFRLRARFVNLRWISLPGNGYGRSCERASHSNSQHSKRRGPRSFGDANLRSEFRSLISIAMKVTSTTDTNMGRLAARFESAGRGIFTTDLRSAPLMESDECALACR
ncbi:hypothetical protein FA95DRAFT_1367885 [Auriscalpium vulgare]|uniref:Uncharacterized protein n=1 Tax=Auriscalpium vulgare TaxID=40419 RepID=A0ACB8RQN5_9AGAM|nr:hypothetical protein FA95DRAFT_1367885 [Auriscalpium vulgare]